MVSRRDVMTAGVLGPLSTATRAQGGQKEAEQIDDGKIVMQGLREIRQQLDQIRSILDDAMRQNSRAQGTCVPIRRQFDQFLKANGKFPDFCDVGAGAFVEIYDWHVKHTQPVQITRNPDGRMAILFMFTQLVLRHEADANFVGVPYDRG